MSKAIEDVLAERHRQMAVEGWSPEHDDKHTGGELARAAACYATHSTLLGSEVEAIWPWDFAWWKPTDYRRDLVKATALLIAEIERIDRADAIKSWETIDLIKSQRDQLRKALEPFAAFRTPGHLGRYSDRVGDHFRPEAFEAARAAVAASGGGE